MEDIKLNAVVLRAVDYLDNDKILTLFTAERGKITAGIKGIRKAGAKLKFAAQPFCFAEYILAERAGRYTVINASESESFYDLRTDVQKFYAAAASCEAVYSLTEEGDGDEELFLCLVRALSAMCNGNEGEQLVAFLLQCLKRCGYAISVGDCAECKRSLIAEPKIRFSMDGAKFYCWGCGTGVGVSGETYAILRKASGLPHGKVSAEGVKKALKLLHGYTTYKTDAKLTALGQYIQLI